MWVDPIVEEIRQFREAYAAQFNYDLHAIVKDIQRQQQESGREFVTLSPKRPENEFPEMQQSEVVAASHIGTEGKSMQRAQGVGQGR